MEFCHFIEMLDIIWKSLVIVHLKMHVNCSTSITLPCELLLNEGLEYWRNVWVLDAKPFWSFQIQVEVVLACYVIHITLWGLILVTILWKLQWIKWILVIENWKHVYVRTLLTKVENKILRERRYVKPREMITQWVENSSICVFEFSMVSMCTI